MREGSEAMVQDWLYSTELFERETILRLAAQFENVLRHAVLRPETRLGSLEMLNQDQKRALEKEKDARKQSQRQKLMAVEPKTVKLAEVESKGVSES